MSKYYREIVAKPEYQEGWDAYEARQSPDSCPYAKHSPAANAWEAGYDHAAQDNEPEPDLK